MYNERQDALLLCDEIQSKYLDSLSKISLLQTLNAVASSTSTRLRKEKNAAEEKLVVATAQSGCMKHKTQAASMRLAEIQLQHPIVEVDKHSVHWCLCGLDISLMSQVCHFRPSDCISESCHQTVEAGRSVLILLAKLSLVQLSLLLNCRCLMTKSHTQKESQPMNLKITHHSWPSTALARTSTRFPVIS